MRYIYKIVIGRNFKSMIYIYIENLQVPTKGLLRHYQMCSLRSTWELGLLQDPINIASDSKYESFK